MKKIFLYLFFTFVTVLSAFSQDNFVFECSFTSNQSYKTLIFLGDDKCEAVKISGNNKRCHYDVKAKVMDNYIFFVLTNPSLFDWTNEVYVISLNNDEHNYCISPIESKSYPLKVEMFEDSVKIAAKKREYGISIR